ncbi:lasso peptide biosynthesis B2 protein, partial [Streptomyces specialis]|uniref:lasso peptide biosynthesis B2 protein n=1 Tax=Streptomyces specialis TaxID=498367 RepID=UPI001F2EBE0C
MPSNRRRDRPGDGARPSGRPPPGRRPRCRPAGQGCLQRALTAALLRRMGGSWPTRCTGVRVAPFRAHVWGEVDGVPVGEPAPPGYRTPTLTVPRRPDAAG